MGTVCGIAVVIGVDEADATARRLIAGIMHRGDITDPVVSPRKDIAMCTRRLRIVDGEHAVQPQPSFDGKLLVSFNGEIYNHLELRLELERQGIRFKTQSDTEVLANALRMWGASALLRLEGMFAFVAVDVATGDYLAARDTFGVKPLYVVRSPSGVLFCSEIRPLLDATDTGDVMLLPPGFLLTRSLCVRFGARQTHHTTFTQSSPKQLDQIMSEAVRIRVPPDLPIAVMFSGGIDSTLVAHYARQVRPETPGYMLGGETAPDFPFAQRYAEQTGFDLRTVPFEPASATTLPLIDSIVEDTESFEPAVIRGSLCSYLVSQRIHKDGYRVALCGEGADELFAGYIHLQYAFSLGNTQGHLVRQQQLASMHSTNLQLVDRCSMHFAVEAREPFLDSRVVAHALRLDASALVRTIDGNPQGKAALRDLYDLYPEQLPILIRNRIKVPFEEGAGIDATGSASPWAAMFENIITDKELEDGMRQFTAFEIASKEELFYIRKLANTLDLSRIPHLQGRLKLFVPAGTPGSVPLAKPLRDGPVRHQIV